MNGVLVVKYGEHYMSSGMSIEIAWSSQKGVVLELSQKRKRFLVC